MEAIKKHFETSGFEADVKFMACHNTSLITNMGLVANGFGLSMCSAKAAENYQCIGYKTLSLTQEIPREFGLAVTARSLKQPFIKNFVSYFLKKRNNH